MSSSSSENEPEIEEILEIEEQESTEDPPMSEWSSLEVKIEEENKKRRLHSQGLYSPGSGELCAKYIAQSDSDIFRHLYYNYPAVHDPGIKAAILAPEIPVIYGDDGQDLYLSLCKDMNICPVRMFHRGLLSSEINLSYYGMNPAGVRPMAIALQYNKHVTSLDLTDNFLNDDACYHLGQMLRPNITLQELNLTGCRIGSTGLFRFGESLSANKTLKSLNLSRNNIGEQGGAHFAKIIASGATVKRVNLSNNNMGRLSAIALAEIFLYKDVMTHLDLSWNNFFNSPSTAKMLEALADSRKLQELNLAWNSMEGERVAEAIKEIILIPSLIKLNLSNNRFCGEAVPIIVSTLMKAKKLITLDLSFNPLSPGDAVIVLEKMLRPRVKIENLNMEGVWVNKKFIIILDRVRKMKSRKNFQIIYDGVLENWTISGADARTVILKRADYLGNLNKKRKVDVAQFFLTVNKEYTKPISVKDFIDRRDAENVPIDDGLITELAIIFPGPKSAKTKSINLKDLCEYMQRLWPDRKLPPTPPPEPEPEPIPEPEPVPKKGKKGKK